jgi:hypothetical protein
MSIVTMADERPLGSDGAESRGIEQAPGRD